MERIKTKTNMNYKATVFTFSECVESDQSVPAYGTKGPGLTGEDLKKIREKTHGTIYNLKDYYTDAPDAYVLHVPTKEGRRNTNMKTLSDALWKEVNQMGKEDMDTQAWFRGKLLNKNARWNFNVTDIEQKGDMSQKIMTLYKFDRFPPLETMRNTLSDIGDLTGIKRMKNLYAEANVYHKKGCGIGWHGDKERGIVIGWNLGESRYIHWNMYHRSIPRGKPFRIKLNHGDMYMMCQKAGGADWKKSSLKTYRHMAGDESWCNKQESIMRRKLNKKLSSRRKMKKKK